MDHRTLDYRPQIISDKGYGNAVVDHLIDMVHDFDNSEMVIARFAPDNDTARRLFERLNFEQQEKMFRGRHIAILEFEFEDNEDDEDDDAKYDEDDAEYDEDDDAEYDEDDDAEYMKTTTRNTMKTTMRSTMRKKPITRMKIRTIHSSHI